MNARYSFTESGLTVIDNYNEARAFSSFFPAIAGLDGIPMWAFYVNRGQCIASFGPQDKDRGILEFHSANRSYQLAPLVGFRTFLKVLAGGKAVVYEPFRPSVANERDGCTNQMIFGPAFLKLVETNPAIGLKVEVTFITVPGEVFCAMARQVRVENISGAPMSVELADGLPYVKSYGLLQGHVKFMSCTSEAWVGVSNYDKNVPVYKLKIQITDRPEQDELDHGGTFSAFFDGAGKLLPAIIDPAAIFGPRTDLNIPQAFVEATPYRLPSMQTFENYTPCAMTVATLPLAAGESRQIHAVIGHANDSRRVDEFAARCAGPEWFAAKLARNEKIMADLLNNAATFSASPNFDNYSRLTFLDNTLRGGLPVTLTDAGGVKHVFNVFSRVHGDMERDYNHIVVEPAFWSQGNGNYRDVAQNRRNDIWFNPDVRDSAIFYFMNLLQLDGYNPIRLRGSYFELQDVAGMDAVLASAVADEAQRASLGKLLRKPFSPGGLLTAMAENNIALSMPAMDLLGQAVSRSRRVEDVIFGEGYWSDHWIYNIDFLDSFLSLYPEGLEDLLVGNRRYTYHQPCVQVNPRSVRYVLRDGKGFQTHNVAHDEEKLKAQSFLDNCVRTQNGKGEVYHTSLAGKLLCLAAVKLATLDPFGVGVEMEGGKPNWDDSINGLPGIFGSSVNETIEIYRLVKFLLEACGKKAFASIDVPIEVARLIRELKRILKETGVEQDKAFEFWDRSNTVKEQFRAAVKSGIRGPERALSATYVRGFLKAAAAKLQAGIERSLDAKTGLVNSYFWHDLVEYDLGDDHGRQVIVPRRFTQTPATAFLEGPVHYLRIAEPEAAAKQHQAVKASGLYDAKLGMYKVCASLKDQPSQLGRVKSFTPGWLENESIWLHMEYKYLLELLRSGQGGAFYEAFAKAGVCFQDPQVYGRSILENVSFLVCSANPNEKLHGGGFYARLSGATAEFMSMWLYMNLGPRPFYLDEEGRLSMRFAPVLPGWLFATAARDVSFLRNGQAATARLPAGHYAFVLLGKTLVAYVNAAGVDTFGPIGARASGIDLVDDAGRSTHVDGGVLGADLAAAVRAGEFKTITVTLS